MNSFEQIKVIVWDVDSTLYPPTDALHQAIRSDEIKVIMDHMGWSQQKATDEFYKVYKIVSPSGTQTAAAITGLPIDTVAKKMGQMIKDAKSKYLSRDRKLVNLFVTLKKYQHYILSNGSFEGVVDTIEILGLEPEIFTEIVTSEIVGDNKPSLAGFRYIIEKSGYEPGQHLMVGDRDAVDIEPAQKAGMKTCMVWGKSPIADISLMTVYEIRKVLDL